MKPGTVTIHVVPAMARSLKSDRRILSNDEEKRAASFRFPKDAARWTGFRAALRRILGQAIRVPPRDVPLELTEFGKPIVATPFEHLHFSISHCSDLALVALCTDGPVGIDLEPSSRAPDLSGCETAFCHPTEVAALPAEQSPRNLRLLEIWTAKEALLKALGTGFSHPPESVCIHLGASRFTATSEVPLPGIEQHIIHRLHHPLLANHCATLSAPASVSRIEISPLEASTSGVHSETTDPRSMKSDG
jgi:4'-phosphopantetheinyl transferase